MRPSCVGINCDANVDIIRDLMNKQGFLFAVIWRRSISSIDATGRCVRLRTVILGVQILLLLPRNGTNQAFALKPVRLSERNLFLSKMGIWVSGLNQLFAKQPTRKGPQVRILLSPPDSQC